MANDPNTAIAALNTDLSAISTDYDPQIKAQRTAAEGLESKSVQASEAESQQAERAAQAATSDESQIKAWADSTPTRQAAYANAMHAAPILSILTALGGRLTKLNGQQMLAATTGIVQGVNAGSEKKYEDAYNAWMSSYQKIKDHHARMMEYYRLMLDAYAGRADAPQKAAEAARRMAGDLLDEKQMKLSNTLNTFKAIEAVQDRLDRTKLAHEAVHEKTLTDLGLPPGWSQDDIDFYARQEIAGDRTWRVGLSRAPGGAKIIAAALKRVPVLARMFNIGPEQASTTKDIRKSIDAALTDRTKYLAVGTQFVSNFQKQADLVEKYLETGVGGATPVFNRWIQAGRAQVEGDPDVTKLDVAIRGLAREHQRIVTGLTSNAQLHVSAQETADKLANRDMTADQIRGSLQVMREEATNAVQSGKDEVGELQHQLGQLGIAGAEARAAGPMATPTRHAIDIGTSQSTGQRYIRYSDGTVEPVPSTSP
jgi:hypothetical protein